VKKPNRHLTVRSRRLRLLGLVESFHSTGIAWTGNNKRGLVAICAVNKAHAERFVREISTTRVTSNSRYRWRAMWPPMYSDSREAVLVKLYAQLFGYCRAIEEKLRLCG
jgi:hypothetical protein